MTRIQQATGLIDASQLVVVEKGLCTLDQIAAARASWSKLLMKSCWLSTRIKAAFFFLEIFLVL